MKILTMAMLTIGAVLLAQDPLQVQIQINQAGPLVSPGMDVVGGEFGGNRKVQGAPYSAEAILETTETAGDGSPVMHKTSTMLYRDGEGRERRETGPTVTISDPVSGLTYVLDAANRTARRTTLPRIQNLANQNVTIQGGIIVTGSLMTPSAQPQRPVMNSLPSIEQLGVIEIEGIQAAGTLTTVTIPASQAGDNENIHIISEQWYSPQLRMTILSKHNDPRTGVTEYRLTHISRKEPPASLFQIPAGYTIIDAELMPR